MFQFVGDESTGIIGNIPVDQLRDMLKNQLEYYFSRYLTAILYSTWTVDMISCS